MSPKVQVGAASRARARCTPTREVHHAIQPAFKAHTPYLVLLVDLDTQKGKPTEHEALRVVGNLATPDGKLAPPEMRQKGRHRHARAHGVCRCGAGPRPAAMDDRRERTATRQSRGAIRRSDAPRSIVTGGMKGRYQGNSASSIASNANGAWKPGRCFTLSDHFAKFAQRLRSNAQISANATSP